MNTPTKNVVIEGHDPFEEEQIQIENRPLEFVNDGFYLTWKYPRHLSRLNPRERPSLIYGNIIESIDESDSQEVNFLSGVIFRDEASNENLANFSNNYFVLNDDLEPPTVQEFSSMLIDRNYFAEIQNYYNNLPKFVLDTVIIQTNDINDVWNRSNMMLRGENVDSRFVPKHINNLQKTILDAPMLDHTIILFRTNKTGLGRDYRAGQQVIVDQFCHTSIVLSHIILDYFDNSCGCCLWRLVIPEGTPILYTTSENQVILPHGSIFTVIDDSKLKRVYSSGELRDIYVTEMVLDGFS